MTESLSIHLKTFQDALNGRGKLRQLDQNSKVSKPIIMDDLCVTIEEHVPHTDIPIWLQVTHVAQF